MASLPDLPPILVLDGGLGTTLEDDHDVKFSSTSTPLWSSHTLISSPSTLLKAQSSFVKAGADVLLTATYQASIPGFKSTPRLDGAEAGYGREEAEAYMKDGVRISRSAFEENGKVEEWSQEGDRRRRDKRRGLVALSLGAYGATLVPSQEYTGNYPAESGTVDALYEFHSERLRVFTSHAETWSNVDIIAFETLPLLDEVKAVRRAMKKLEKDGVEKPYWISCVFPSDLLSLPDGTNIEDLVVTMLDPTLGPLPWGIGINCTKVQRLPPLVAAFSDVLEALAKHPHTGFPGPAMAPRLVVYPDGAENLVYDTATQKWLHSEGENGSGSQGSQWDDTVINCLQGALRKEIWDGILVGGCCKTGPGHIQRLRTGFHI
jgi:homocysteine S-methyltransferase